MINIVIMFLGFLASSWMTAMLVQDSIFTGCTERGQYEIEAKYHPTVIKCEVVTEVSNVNK
ncbi:hypothetical protein [Pseudoalteromonas rubra]|uniref:hypothetical protein n=1 Tax=Pseudoalteromonas rubra TaxID=43658 RepID=UPI002DB9A471|nr:hypothetical protein [Pseudoalteromonas rubra]MEC4091142.1 hypothetical protein [Pseudoalteromonas rubra]